MQKLDLKLWMYSTQGKSKKSVLKLHNLGAKKAKNRSFCEKINSLGQYLDLNLNIDPKSYFFHRMVYFWLYLHFLPLGHAI